MQRDLNRCTARQLTAIPGIDTRLAEGIIRFKQTHGQFTHFDELWQVSGMNRSKYHLLRRHYRVVGEKPLMMGTKLPYARMSLTESIMDFVCQGQSVKTSQTSVPAPTLEVRKRVSEVLSKTKCTPQNLPTSLQAKSGVPVTKIFASGKTRPSMLVTSNTPHETDGVLRENREKPTKATPNSTDGQGQQQPVSLDSYHQDIELLQTLAPTRIRRAWAQSPEKPSVTLKTSPSGNNINFSCTFDKRMLRQSTSVAFQMDEGALGHQRASDPLCNSADYKKPRTSPAGNKMEQSPDDSISEYQTAVQAEHMPVPPTGQHLPALRRSGEVPAGYPSLLVTREPSSTSSSRLSQDNLIVYERHNTLDQSDRKHLIEAWISDVNEAQEVGKLLRGRERITSPFNSGKGKFSGHLKKQNNKHTDNYVQPKSIARPKPQKSPPPRNLSPTKVTQDPGEREPQVTKRLTFGNCVDGLHGEHSHTIQMSRPSTTSKKDHTTTKPKIAKVKDKIPERKIHKASHVMTSQNAARRKATVSANVTSKTKKYNITKKHKSQICQQMETLSYRHCLHGKPPDTDDVTQPVPNMTAMTVPKAKIGDVLKGQHIFDKSKHQESTQHIRSKQKRITNATNAVHSMSEENVACNMM